MKRLERLAPGLLIALCIYGYFAVGLPYSIALLSSNSFEDKRLTEVQSLGRFTYGQFSAVKYELQGDNESVSEASFMGLIFGKNLIIRTTRQESGVYTIKWVMFGSQSYEKTLRDHPEVLAEAEKVLQLGRDNFAKAKKKLEQKSKPNQSDRLG